MNCPNCTHPVPESTLAVHDAFVRLASAAEERTGVLGHATVLVGPFRIAGLTVRLTRDDRLIVTFPAKSKVGERRNYVVVPLEPELRARIEASVIAAYIEARRRAGRIS